VTSTVYVCSSLLGPDASGPDWLDETERGRSGRLVRIEDRRRFLTSRVLLKTVIGQLTDTPPALVRLNYDCPLCGRSHGRPVVVEPPAPVRWHVSISHTDALVMVAATDAGPVGVDIERTAATGFDGFDEVALTSRERTEVERCAPAAQAWARAVYWTRKEAVLKATGRGLAIDPCMLEISAPHLPAVLTGWHVDEPLAAPAQITDIPVDDDHVAAVAVLAPGPCELVLLSPPGSGRGQTG
jgi:4'-phosphopantetheinyl transferase